MTEPPVTRRSLAERIREAIVDAMESGGPIDWDALRALFPGEQEAVERQAAVARDYLRLRAAASSDSPVAAACRGTGTHPRAAEPLAPGTRLGDFEVRAHLADGGMGRVYEAAQLSLGGRAVALKVMTLDGAQGSRARFRREALSLADVHHAHLAEVHGFGEEQGLLYYAMDLVSGPTLRDVLEQWRGLETPPGARPALRRAAVHWSAQIAGALATLHRAGLVHRDVKPSNIIVRGQPLSDPGGLGAPPPSPGERTGPGSEAVLVDFGLVKPLGPQDATWTAAGAASRAYAPPEQLIGHTVGPAADVFSLGVTLFDMLSGRGADERPQASLGLPRLDEVIAGFDADLAAVVAKAVEPSARWRYADAGELLADLRSWLAGHDVAARRPPLGERVLRRLRREPRLLLTRAVLLGVLVSGVVALTSAATYREVMRSVADASRDGDLRGVAEGLDTLRAWAVVPMAVDGFAGARREFLAGGQVTAGIATSLRQGDQEAAVGAAVAALTRDGYQRHPLLLRFLAGLVRTQRVGSVDETRSRSVAAAVARLLTDRVVGTPEDVVATAPLREAVRGAWQRRDEPAHVRWELVSGLSGCATPDDLAPLLGWTLSNARGEEPYRLGMMCIQRILDRSQACGMLHELPPASTWSALEAECSREFAGPDWSGLDPVTWNARFGLLSATLSYLIAYRAAGAPVDPRRFLPPHWVEALVDRQSGEPPLRDPGDAPLLLAASGDPLVADWLSSSAPGTRERPWGLRSALWGLMCGMLGDEQVTARARSRIAEPGPGPRHATQGELERFDQGVARGRRLRGSDLEVTGLGERTASAAVGSAGPTPLVFEMERRDDESAAKVPPFGVELDHLPPSSSGPALASWSFREAPALVAAGGRNAVAVGVRHVPDEGGGYRLDLGNVGESIVRLPFLLETGGRPLRVIIRQQGEGRWHLPYGGRVVLEVSLDGQVLQRQTVMDPTIRDLGIELQANLATAGAHELSLRLHEDSTTACWLHLLWIDAP